MGFSRYTAPRTQIQSLAIARIIDKQQELLRILTIEESYPPISISFLYSHKNETAFSPNTILQAPELKTWSGYQASKPSNSPSQHTTYKLNTNLSLSEIRPNSNVKVIIIVLSSWTESGYMKRQSFRDTSVKLIPQNSKDLSITYRFVLGDVPSAKLQLNMGHKLLDESKRYGDIIILVNWKNQDPIKNIIGETWILEFPPIRNAENKYADFDYKLPIFPPFTAGILYILSSDIISLIVIDAPHILQGTMDDQSMRMLSITEGYVKDLDKGFQIFDDPINVTIGSKEDEWIFRIFSHKFFSYSQTNQWYLLHWVCWTTDPTTFSERHYKTIEFIWIHTPKAVLGNWTILDTIVFVLSTTLPPDFFSEYQKQGYQIQVINFDKGSLLERQWFLGQNSKNLLHDWNTVLLPTQALNSLDRMFQVFLRTIFGRGRHVRCTGIMRFRKGRSMFKEVMERVFTPTYSTSCFNCVGHRAITINVDHVDKLLRPAQEGLHRIEIFHGTRNSPLKADEEPDLKNWTSSYSFLLEGPKKYRFVSPTVIQEVDKYPGSLNGQFQGLNVIFIRGRPGTATIRVKSLNGKLSFDLLDGDWSETSMTFHNRTKKTLTLS
ncbi:2849_t:CDS:10 [Funneliformis geosporum]|uniref:2849_t:CDS:1 n=1 Tax=Funneliformis geosporum TaxID=1117311 RepID=A0A9W4SKG1_9GLOM|nr:2849_t:CDS:10 [Funneliformis geosporum]